MEMNSCAPVMATWQDFVDSREAAVDIPEDNGFLLSGVLVPDDVLETILSIVPIEDFLKCNLVCRAWKDLISRKSLWKLRYKWARKEHKWEVIPAQVREKPLAWIVLYSNLIHDTFSKNFIANPSGQRGFEGWTPFRTNEWQLEQTPHGCDPLPTDTFFGPDDQSCFASTYFWCNQMYKIDLWSEGFNPSVMKICLPCQLNCSIMYNARFDCRSEGTWSLGLLDSDEQLILVRETKFTRDASVHWDKAEKTFRFKQSDISLMKNLRFLVFVLRGKDRQFWAGHYGMKFARACVTVQFLSSDPTAESVFDEAKSQPGPEYFDFNLRALNNTSPSNDSYVEYNFRGDSDDSDGDDNPDDLDDDFD